MTKPTISLQELRAKIGHRAKSAPAHRFWGLHVHLVKLDDARSRVPGGKAQRRRPWVRRRDVRGDRGARPGTNSSRSSRRSCAPARTAPGRIDEERFRRRAARSA